MREYTSYAAGTPADNAACGFAGSTGIFAKDGCTAIFIAVDGMPAGFLALSDTLRPSAVQTIAGIQKMGD